MSWNPEASLKATPPPAIMPSVVTTGPWPVHYKRSDTSRMVSHTHPAQQQSLQQILWYAPFSVGCKAHISMA